MKNTSANPCQIWVFVQCECQINRIPDLKIELMQRPSNTGSALAGGNPDVASSRFSSLFLSPRPAMLRLSNPQGSLWDQLLPIQVRRLSAELTAIDTCLADERFFEPYLQRSTR